MSISSYIIYLYIYIHGKCLLNPRVFTRGYAIKQNHTDLWLLYQSVCGQAFQCAGHQLYAIYQPTVRALGCPDFDLNDGK